MLASLRAYVPRLGVKTRRLAALACLLLAGLTALSAHRTGAGAVPRTRPVLVAARDLPAGHVLGTRDVAVRLWPKATGPPSAFVRLRAAVGRRLAAPLARGEPVTPVRLAGRDLLAGQPGGSVASAVVLTTPHAADLVRAGDVVDVLGAATDGTGSVGPPQTVLTGATVLAVLPTTDAVSGSAGAELIVATDQEQAFRLARASSSHIFTVLVESP